MSTAVVGVVGAGQLARMMQQAAVGLDIHVRVLAATPHDSAAQVCPDVVVGPIAEELPAFAATCDVVTFDHELVDPDALATAADAGHLLHPGPEALRFAQDKGYQRETFAQAGLPLPAYAIVADVEEAAAFAARAGWPLVLKSPLGGYDGRGVEVVESQGALERVWARLAPGPLLVEEHIDLRAEFAVLVARRPSGEAVTYPLVETVQEEGILTRSRVPAAFPDDVVERAHEIGFAVAEVVGAVGILAVELFFDGDRVLVNEVATRPHNSGHWTIEGAMTSQFANHLRGVLDWPLGDTRLTAPAVATANVLGPHDGSDPRTRMADALAVRGVGIHLYGKEARPGRKLGHVTATGATAGESMTAARHCVAILRGEPLDE